MGGSRNVHARPSPAPLLPPPQYPPGHGSGPRNTTQARYVTNVHADPLTIDTSTLRQPTYTRILPLLDSPLPEHGWVGGCSETRSAPCWHGIPVAVAGLCQSDLTNRCHSECDAGGYPANLEGLARRVPIGTISHGFHHACMLSSPSYFTLTGLIQ